MKNLLYISLIFVLFSCGSEERPFAPKEIPEEETTKTEEEVLKEGFIGDDNSISILYTDSNYVSVFDKSSYNWSKSGFVLYHVIDGKKEVVDLKAEGVRYDNPTGLSYNKEFPNWLNVHINYEGSDEYKMTLLKLPDNSVDTIICTKGDYILDGVFNGRYMKKLWYNSELKYDASVYHFDKVEYFPDGRQWIDKEIHIVK